MNGPVVGRSADLPRTSGEIDGDDTGCHILHADMDAFFASVEIRARPELRGLPVVVGGTQGRGVVAAASYEARRYGIRSAMSMAQALRLCPRAVVIAPTRGAYSEASRAIMEIFNEFTPSVEPLSLDEAFLDVTGAVGLFGRPADIARQIRRRVFEDQQLTCSIGIAPIKSVAKLASGSCKPNGLRVVSRAGLLDFLHPLPVTALWGVGQATAEPLRRLGIRTVGELAETPIGALRRAVGIATANHLHALASGHDDRVVTPRQAEKSISTDRTLLHDLLTETEVAKELLRGAVEVTERLRQANRTARTVGIKIRFADFTTLTRVRTLAEPTDSSKEVYAASLALYRTLSLDRPRIRLVGVKLENLRPNDEAVQLALDLTGGQKPQRSATDRAVDLLTSRFGESAVRPASLLSPMPHVRHESRNRPASGPSEATGR
ncbi:DNA polymerase IV [soil metagenome]